MGTRYNDRISDPRVVLMEADSLTGAKRKQKCNRQFPCNHCLARKVPHLCIPYNPQAASSSSPDPHTASRIEQVEDVLSVIVRHHGGLWGYAGVKEFMKSGAFARVFPSGQGTIEGVGTGGGMEGKGEDDHEHAHEGEAEEKAGSVEDDGGVGKGWLGELDG